MSRGPNKPGKGFVQDIDLRLDGLLGELGRALGEAMERLGDGVSEVRRTEDIQTSKGPIRAEAGIRVRMGGIETAQGADPQPFNTPSASADTSPAKPAARAISATIVDEQGFWSLTADMPGVSRQDVDLSCAGDVLTITAETDGRAYHGRFTMPAGTTIDDIDMSLRNGILDLTAKRPSETNQ